MNRTAAVDGFALLPDDQLAFVEAGCDWTFITDKTFVICYVHKGRQVKDDIVPQYLLGKPFETFLPVDARGETMQRILALSGQSDGSATTAFVDRLTGLHDVRCIPRAAEGEEGYVITVRHYSAENVGELRRALYGEDVSSTSLQASLLVEQQRLIADLSKAFVRHSDRSLRKLFDYVLGELGSFMGVERCSIFRHRAQTHTYGVKYEWCAKGVASTKDFLQNIPYNDDDEGFVQLSTRPYIAVDDTFQYSGDEYRVQREGGIHAFADLPIIIDKQLWGFLGVDYSRHAHHWTQSEFHMLQTIVGMIATAIEKQRVENELSDAYSKLSEIVQSYPGIIWTVDKHNCLTLLEGKALAGLEIDREKLIGAELSTLESVTGLQETKLFGGHDKVLLGEDDSYFATLADRHFACETTVLTKQDGEANGVVGVALDVTEMQNMQMRLEKAMEEAEEASRAKSDFLSRMSHEIRTPMNAIIGMNEIAKTAGDPKRVRYCLDKIEQASHQLLGIINDILDLSKIETGKMEISTAPFDYEKMLENVFNIVQGRVDEKELEFAFQFDAPLRSCIVGDELRLTQVVTNLLSNAVKFTPQGGHIALLSRLTQDEAGKNACLRVEVSDTGIGISQEHIEKLFRPFEQADGSITRRFGGSGLGLNICRQLITLMGGNIWVESELGVGSRFIFEVPVTLGESIEVKAKNLPDVTRLRILMVDDDCDTLAYCKQTIEGFHMHCDTAQSGEKALEMLRDNPKGYDIILLDYLMPGMDGIQTAKELQKLVSPETIVIMVSAASWNAIEPEASKIGITRYLPKPLLPSALFNAIVEIKSHAAFAQEAKGNPSHYDWASKTLLLAEDIDINQEIACALLEPTGIQIDCANNGKVAIEKYLLDPERYDLVLMDLQMPEMDGFEATRLLRKSHTANAQSIPVLAMTANAFSEDVTKCLECGMNGHISKPIDLSELLEKLAVYLGPARGER